MRIDIIPEQKIKVYELSELPDDIQKKIIEKHYNINFDNDFWDDGDYALSQKYLDGIDKKHLSKAARLAVKNNDVLTLIPDCFDLDHGAYLQIKDGPREKNGVRRNNAGPEIKDNGIFLEILGISPALQKQVNIYYSFNNDRENNTAISFEYDWNDDNDHRDTTIIDNILEAASETWDNIVDDGLRQLRDNYEYLQSEEAIKETIEAIGYEFTIDGEVY